MNEQRVGGIDPGPRSGLVILHIARSGRNPGDIFRLERGSHLTWQRVVAESTHVAIEKYVRGRASVKFSDSAAQLETQEIAVAAHRAAIAGKRPAQVLPAGSVKPWADDDRLRAYLVGARTRGAQDDRPTLYEMSRGGGGHDRDATRHALNFAVKLGLLPHR